MRIVVPPARTCPESPHFTCESGRTGRVISDRPFHVVASHPFLVMLDRHPDDASQPRLARATLARFYAADELEPLG